MMPPAAEHGDQCDWHLDQYPWECTCGAIPNPDQFKPKGMKVPAEPNSQSTSEEKE